MKATWSGKIGFGQILVTAKLYSASEKLTTGLHMVHAADGGQIGYKTYCKHCNAEVTRSDIHKGLEVNGNMLHFSGEELDALRPEVSEVMKILGFCPINKVPLIAFSTPYYLGTGTGKKANSQAFWLLHESMVKSGKCAIVQWVSHGTQVTAVMVPAGKGFLLKALMYPNQIRAPQDIPVEDATVSDELVAKGMKVVEKMSFDFDYGSLRETHSEALKKYIDDKIAGRAQEPAKAVAATASKSLEAELEQMLA